MFHSAILQIVWIQNVFQFAESFLSAISIITHPKVMYIYFLPIFAAFDLHLYCSLMFTAVSSDYINILLKWILAEARPFWWIYENGNYTDINRPNIRQTIITCETTSGNPSGHVMHQTAIFYVIVKKLIELIEQNVRYDKKNIIYATWTLYVGFLMIISISRMYFACHFLHQCVIGAFIGYALTKFLITYKNGIIRNRFFNSSPTTTFKIGIIMAIIGVAIYVCQALIGINPQWSIQYAFKWCHNPYYLNPDTTPLFSMVREFGILLGLIFSSPLSNRFITDINYKWSVPITIGLMVLYHMILLYVPRHDGVLVYFGFTFLTHFLLVFTILHVIPKCCIKIHNNKTD